MLGTASEIAGISLALVSALCYGLANVAVFRAAQQGRSAGGLGLSISLTAVFSLVLFFSVGDLGLVLDLPREQLWIGLFWFAVAGILATVLGRALLFVSVAEIGAVRGAAMKRLTPFFAVPFAWLVLDEPVTALMLAGMAIIALAFLLLLPGGSAIPRAEKGGTRPLRILAGPGSAAAYAAGYVTRKQGMIAVPDPALGALVSSIAATAFFIYQPRRPVSGVPWWRRLPGRWATAAAVLISVGQISSFYAIDLIGVSKVAVIVAAEAFITLLVSSFVLRIERNPGAAALAAILLGFLGTICVTLG